MSLTIGRLRVRTSIPRRLTTLASAVDDAVRRDFASALARTHVEEAVPRAVCRIRQLIVRIKVTPDEVRQLKLPQLWADAFARALAVAVADAGSSDVLAAESRAHWLAQYLLRLVDGQPVDAWAYGEFSATASLPSAEAIVALLEANPSDAVEVLTILDSELNLGRAIARLDAGQLARLLGLLDRSAAPPGRRLGLDDVYEVAELMIEAARSADYPAATTALSAVGGPSLGDAQSILLFVAQLRIRVLGTRRLSAGRIRDALRLIEWLYGLQIALPSEARMRVVAAAVSQLRQGQLPAMDISLAELVLSTRAVFGVTDDDLNVAKDVSLTLERIQSQIPTIGAATARQLEARWVDSDLASMFLLVGVVRRLGWPARIRMSRCWEEYGPRALTYTLAGTALAIAGRPIDLSEADPGLLLFAGWIDQPDVRGFRRWLDGSATVNPGNDDRRDLLASLLDDESDEERPTGAEASWESTFGLLAHTLVRQFARSLRGFRQSGDRFIIDRLLSASGRVLVEPERLVVSLEPNPLWVAVRLSGADSPIDSVEWLSNRRLELELGGL
jgi:hypothetical protein